MDAFVTITPKRRDAARKESPAKYFKQTTIKDLPGVVSIDTVIPLCLKVVELANATKESTDATTSTSDELLNSLRALHGVRMQLEILRTTKIGETINRLRKHPNEDVARVAQEFYDSWKACAHDSLVREAKRSTGDKRPRTEATAPASQQPAKKLRSKHEAREFMHEMEEWDAHLTVASASKRAVDG